MQEFRYFEPTEIFFGDGALAMLRDKCAAVGARPLIVTGRNSARRCGAIDTLRAQWPDAAVFDEVEENPTTATCERGAAFCREAGCTGVVGVGGGSPMDAAKAVAVLARNPKPCARYFGADRYETPGLPMAAVPTTAGTGSEVTPYAVLVDTEARSKRTIAGRALFPVVACLDPTLSVTMPRSVTVHTGLDALSQAMEGMVSRKSTPIGDALALETCRIVKEWLPRAASEPESLEARGWMLHAAMLSGCIIAQSGTTLVHGMGYYFTLEFGLSHGLANALLLTPLFRYNARHVPGKVAALAAALGQPVGSDPGEAIAEAIYTLLSELEVSPTARDAGVDPARMRDFAEDICADRPRFKNQPGDPALEEVEAFFLAACL